MYLSGHLNFVEGFGGMGPSGLKNRPTPMPISGPSVSRAGADLMLLLLQSKIPSGEMLTAKSDREMALLAIKYGIRLPPHLSHLPTLPPPKTEEEKARNAKLAADTEAAEDAHAGTPAVIKERPPRHARMRLGHINEIVEAPTGQTPLSTRLPSTACSPPSSATGSPAATTPRRSLLPADDSAVENELLGSGHGTKERAPSNRKKKGKKVKPDAAVAATAIGIADIIADLSRPFPEEEQELVGAGRAVKERPPSNRKVKKGK